MYVNAGHPHPLHFHGDERHAAASRPALVLGPTPHATYTPRVPELRARATRCCSTPTGWSRPTARTTRSSAPDGCRRPSSRCATVRATRSRASSCGASRSGPAAGSPRTTARSSSSSGTSGRRRTANAGRLGDLPGAEGPVGREAQRLRPSTRDQNVGRRQDSMFSARYGVARYRWHEAAAGGCVTSAPRPGTAVDTTAGSPEDGDFRRRRASTGRARRRPMGSEATVNCFQGSRCARDRITRLTTLDAPRLWTTRRRFAVGAPADRERRLARCRPRGAMPRPERQKVGQAVVVHVRERSTVGR